MLDTPDSARTKRAEFQQVAPATDWPLEPAITAANWLTRSSSVPEEKPMPNYVDGYVLPVPKKNLAAYRRMAAKAGKVWMEHGALAYNECVADDVSPGKVTSFPQAVKLKDDETVIFAWIVYKSRKDRDRINAAVMKDKRMQEPPKDMPFDGKRMFWGGFKGIVEL
jgi:uncharacterized protein YbaA (DUF1428 family)